MNAERRTQSAKWRRRKNLRWLLSVFCCWHSAFCIPRSAFSADATGAKVDESKVVRTYYVDAAGADAADDDKHGTQDSPFVTIRRALDAALRDTDAGSGAKIIIAPGTYRETIELPPPPAGKSSEAAPLVIEAAERDQTIIDAADADGWSLDTWKKDGAGWVHPWPFTPAPTPAPGRGRSRDSAGKVSHAELVFFNGNGLRQVDTPAALAPGTFCIVRSTDRKNPGTTVRAVPPEGEDEPTANAFSVGVRQTGLHATARRNLVVRGLLFQHTTNPTDRPQSRSDGPLVFERCSNVLIEDVLTQWNNEAGLIIDGGDQAPWSADITLRRVRCIHNGTSGLELLRVKNVLAEDCETSFNNFREAWGGTINPQGPVGMRAQAVHGSTWRRHRAVDNASRGLCWTSDCTDLLVEDAVVRDNLFSGLLIENSPGPTTVRGCLVADNKVPAGARPELSQPAAISVEASPDVTLENNVVAGNVMPQLGLRNVAERTDGANFETGTRTTLRAERHVYRHNAFWGANPDQPLIDLPVTDATGKGDFAWYYTTLDSDENCFWNPASAEVFCTFERTAYRRPGMSLAGWRTFLAAHGGGTRKPETGSLWQDPQFMEPAEGDYRLQSQSPLIDWGLPAEESGAAQ